MNFNIKLKAHAMCLMVVLCQINTIAWSQDRTLPLSSDGTLQLSKLLSQADHYPSVQALTQAIQAAEMNQQLTKQEGLPQFDIQAQNSYGTYVGAAGASFPLPGAYNVSGTNTTNEQALNLQVSGIAHWDLIQFGKLRNKMNAAQLKTSSAQKQLEAGVWQYKYQLTRNFIQLVFHEQMVKWADSSRQRQLRLMGISQSLAVAGMVAGADTLLSNARLQQSIAVKNNWQGTLQANYSQIKQWVPDLPGSLPALPSLFARPIAANHTFEETPTIHPLIQIKNPAIALTRVEQEGVSKAVLPNISILAAGQLRGFAPGETALASVYGLPTRNYLAGIAVTWKLAPLYQKNILERRFALQRGQLQSEQSAVQLKIDAEKSAAEAQIVKAAAQISAFEKSLELSRQAYRLYQVRYQSGLIDLATLLQVEQTLQDAEKERLIAYYHYWTYISSYAAATNDFSLLIQTFH